MTRMNAYRITAIWSDMGMWASGWMGIDDALDHARSIVANLECGTSVDIKIETYDHAASRTELENV